jgi:putative oxidoreductase
MNLLDRGKDHVLALYRIVLGGLFACHGLASLFGVLGGAVGSKGGAVPFGVWPGWWAAAIQLVGGVLVALGLGTRVAALVSSGSMAYAYFTVHQPKGVLPILNGGEPAAIYAWSFVLLVFTGPGAWALGRLFARSSDSVEAVAPVAVAVADAPAEAAPVAG